MSKAWRIAIASTISVIVGLYAIMGAVPILGAYYNWFGIPMGHFAQEQVWAFPFVFIAFFILGTLPMFILGGLLVLMHFGLCRLFGAKIEL